MAGLDGVTGTAAADILRGRKAWDFEDFRGYGGHDTIDGRGGHDGVVFNYHAANGISVNLAAGTVNAGAEGGTDTLRQIEFVIGANFADTFDATGFGGSSTNRNSFGKTFSGYNPLARHRVDQQLVPRRRRQSRRRYARHRGRAVGEQRRRGRDPPGRGDARVDRVQ